MKRFVEGEDRRQAALLPECLDDYVASDNPVRIIEAFVDELDLAALGFAGVVPQPEADDQHPGCWVSAEGSGSLNPLAAADHAQIAASARRSKSRFHTASVKSRP